MNTEKKKRVIIVLGKKLHKDGTMREEHELRCDAAAAAVTSPDEWSHFILLTGGDTAKVNKYESEVAEKYLKDTFVEGSLVEYLIERISKTTGENIFWGQDLLKEKDIIPNEVIFVGGHHQIPRTKKLVQRMWYLGKPTFKYHSVYDSRPFLIGLVDELILSRLNYLDPYERHIMKFLKMLRGR